MLFYRPFRYEVDCASSGQVIDRKGEIICKIVQQQEDDLTANDHAKLNLIVQALNRFDSPGVKIYDIKEEIENAKRTKTQSEEKDD